uniref:F-box domain-containing protein n=1 Tax=Glycine max TaxID=3847 RepID=A0A0R0EGP3_SOYBN
MAKECIHKGEKILRNRKGVKGRNKSVVLPLELITEIFLRLPLKSLIRFKCVCSCRGFILWKARESLWVWNPSTQVPTKQYLPHDFQLLRISLGFFGYHQSTDDYLVVQVSYDINGEFLSLCVMECEHPVEIRIMKEYKIVQVFADDILIECFNLLCLTRSGDIVGMDGRNGLVKCNDEGQLLEHQSYCCGSFGP